MSTVIDVSGKLGEFMLKGWILTDRICKKCSKVPLMRSPIDSTLHFCANCDGGPEQPGSFSSNSARTSLDSGSHISRASTPLTELSEPLSSPTFAPPFDTDEILRRRQQSDLASTEIGKRLLRGWAMLADECPNEGCYGVPLVRPPKAGSERDPRKECVVCHTVYADQADTQGIERLVPMSAEPTKPSVMGTHGYNVPSPDVGLANSKGKNKEIQRDLQPIAPGPDGCLVSSDPIAQASARNLRDRANLLISQDAINTTDALQQSLRALTERLKSTSSPFGMDVASIGQTADSISKVSQALLHLRQLEQSYR